MTNEEMMSRLYERMAAEQQKYKEWLLGQPPNVILDNACQFTIREDIVLEMEVLELTDAQTAALLRSRTPLADGDPPHGRCAGCDRGPRRYRYTG